MFVQRTINDLGIISHRCYTPNAFIYTTTYTKRKIDYQINRQITEVCYTNTNKGERL